MDFQARTVAQGMSEILADVIAGEVIAHGKIDFAAGNAGLDEGYAQLLPFQDEIIEILLGLRRLADDDSPGDVRMVAFPDSTEIEGNKITGFDDFRAGRTVRHGRTPA